MFPDPNKAYSQFVSVTNNAMEKNAFHNFFIVLCHYIINKDISVNAYNIIYTLNRMMQFRDEYKKEDITLSSTSSDIKTKRT